MFILQILMECNIMYQPWLRYLGVASTEVDSQLHMVISPTPKSFRLAPQVALPIRSLCTLDDHFFVISSQSRYWCLFPHTHMCSGMFLSSFCRGMPCFIFYFQDLPSISYQQGLFFLWICFPFQVR